MTRLIPAALVALALAACGADHVSSLSDAEARWLGEYSGTWESSDYSCNTGDLVGHAELVAGSLSVSESGDSLSISAPQLGCTLTLDVAAEDATVARVSERACGERVFRMGGATLSGDAISVHSVAIIGDGEDCVERSIDFVGSRE